MLKNATYIYDNVIIADGINTTKQYCKKTTGVDLSVKSIYKLVSSGVISMTKTYVGDYLNLPPLEFKVIPSGSDSPIYIKGWYLPKGSYICELNEGCQFGDKDVGYIVLRSSLNRNLVHLNSAIWDSGFTTRNSKGEVEGMSVRLDVLTEEGVYLEQNARVGQLLVFEASEGAEQYSNEGHQFQGKGLK